MAPAQALMEDKFILHWLDESRSHRVLWLLDLLELDYEVKIYLRHPETWRGPKELFNAHPTGKSPILDVFFADGSEPMKLAETGFIMQFLLRNYDIKKKFTPTDPRDQLRVDYYLHFAEGSLQNLWLTLLINSVAKEVAPFGLKNVTKVISKGLNNGYYIHEFRLFISYLEKELEKVGTGYFVSDHLTGADIILSFPIYENIFDNLEGVREITREKRDMTKLFPHLAAWSQMIRNDPSYQRVTAYMEEKVAELIQTNPKFTYQHR
ncbi:Gtt13 glutathione S-transferase [Scheffersomyces amazonensis]|uniref:Gtt13 glutathione S-transferase n=1 Tax=Scheffersomyces amazonensis TaxID=1078765 RepID=UPI00315D681A